MSGFEFEFCFTEMKEVKRKKLTVETEKKVMREYEEDMKSGKRVKMDEAEDTLGRFEYEIESTKRSYLHNLLNLLKLKTS